MEENGSTIIVSSDEESPPCKVRKIDKKLHETTKIYHCQRLKNTGYKNQKEVDIINLDEDEPISNKINGNCNMSQKNNELSKQIVEDIKKLPEIELTCHIQKFKNTGIKNEMNNIISLDEDEPTSNKINSNFNMSQEYNELSKQIKIDINKLPETKQTYHFQEFKNSGIKNQKVDDIISLDDDEPTQKNELPKQTELTTVKDDNMGLLSYSEGDEKNEKNSNKLNKVVKFQKEDNIISPNKDKLTSNEIKGPCNISQKNKLPKRTELTSVKDDNKDLLGCDESDEKYENNINKLNKENNEESKSQSTSKEDTSENTSINILTPEFENFLEACKSCNCDIKYKSMILDKLPKIKCKYNDADEKFVNSEKFKKLLITETERIQQKPKNAVLIFNEIYRELEARKKQIINLTDQEERHLNKLYSILRKVHKRVIQLEEEEVNFDDDNNSSYIMLERYKERLCSIQKKICDYTKENFYSGRYLYRSLNFSSSKYSEINRSIDKLYNKKKQFPSFYEVNQCLRKCVTNNNIILTEDALTKEILSVYKALGSILQRRRKTELFDTLSYFLDRSEDDPADQDPEFAALLKKREEENEKKISEVLQKYTDCQGRGEDKEEPTLSSDSDDSHHESDDDDS